MATTVDLIEKSPLRLSEDRYNIRSYFRNGAWTTPEMTSDETVTRTWPPPACITGRRRSEGLKAFRGVDGQVRIFRADENGKRLASSAEYLRMAVPLLELFIDMVKQVVKANERFILAYGTGASSGAFRQRAAGGCEAGDEYPLIFSLRRWALTTKEGLQPDPGDHRPRPRPCRTAGDGTYQKRAVITARASFSSEEAHDKGYPSAVPRREGEKHIDECGAANFFGIRDGRYITPKSHSVLLSITNMSLMTLAADLGLKVESRPALRPKS